jgi:hypothetical protein
MTARDRHDQPQVGLDEAAFCFRIAGPRAPGEVLFLLGREQLDATDVIEVEREDFTIARHRFRRCVGLAQFFWRLGHERLQRFGGVWKLPVCVLNVTHGLRRHEVSLWSC